MNKLDITLITGAIVITIVLKIIINKITMKILDKKEKKETYINKKDMYN